VVEFPLLFMGVSHQISIPLIPFQSQCSLRVAASESPPSLPSLIRVSELTQLIQLKSQLRVVWCASFPLLFPCQVLVPRESLLTRENDELSCAEAENLKLRGESKCCQLVVTIYPPLSHPLPLPLGDLQEINARAW